jgi:hypothetical protein
MKFSGIKNINLLCGIVILTLVCSFTQTNDYKAIIKQALLKYSDYLTIDSGLKIIYETKTLSWDSQQPLVSRYTMMCNSKIMKLENSSIIVIMDTLHSFYINKTEKAIYVHQNTNPRTKRTDLQQMISMLDKTLDNTELVEFTTNNNTAKIKLSINQSVKKSLAISKITYLINNDENNIISVLLEYDNKNSQVKTQEMNFLEQTILVNDVFFKNSIESNIFNRNGELLDEFFGFQVVKY